MYRISINSEEIERLPKVSFTGRIVVIDSLGREYDKAVRYLKRQRLIGFDTESKPVFSHNVRGHGVSLVQLSGASEAYLFRIRKMGMDRELCEILADPRIVKVGAAVNDDVRGLQRYSGFEPRSFVDLQKMVCEYGIRDKSVKKMAAIILGIHISKAQQLSNWEADELTESQLRYAATDAWVCREMYKKLLRSEKHPLSPEQMNPCLENVLSD